MCGGRLVASISVAAACSACSVYPLPQDYTGSTTKEIVKNIRCQARSAVRQAFLDQLNDNLSRKTVKRGYTGRMLADLIEKGDVGFSKLNINEFRGDARKILDYYGTTEVTYEFTLTTSEENKQGASIDLLRKFTRRADTIGISLTEDRMRDVSRTFTLHDSFLFLATKIKNPDCVPKPGIDIIFPLRGQLPVKDLVDTYISINEFAQLDKVKDATKSPPIEGSEKGPATRQMADTITFTTTLQANNSPNIHYNPDGYGFFTSALTFTNENSRKDMHKVIVTLTTTDKPDGHGDFVSTVIPPDARRKSGLDAINSVRFKNLEDDVATIARSLQRNATGF